MCSLHRKHNQRIRIMERTACYLRGRIWCMLMLLHVGTGESIEQNCCWCTHLLAAGPRCFQLLQHILRGPRGQQRVKDNEPLRTNRSSCAGRTAANKLRATINCLIWALVDLWCDHVSTTAMYCTRPCGGPCERVCHFLESHGPASAGRPTHNHQKLIDISLIVKNK